VENLSEDADDAFSVVSYIMKLLHPLLPERNYHGYEKLRRRHERGLPLFLRPTMPNAILYTDSYINIGLVFRRHRWFRL